MAIILDEKQIEKIQRGLKCSYEEAKEVYLDDLKIEKGEKMDFDLTKEQLKEAKKYKNTGTRKTPTVYNFNKKTPKANPTKENLISALEKMLLAYDGVENVTITNKQGKIDFTLDGTDFTFSLTAHRKK